VPALSRSVSRSTDSTDAKDRASLLGGMSLPDASNSGNAIFNRASGTGGSDVAESYIAWGQQLNSLNSVARPVVNGNGMNSFPPSQLGYTSPQVNGQASGSQPRYNKASVDTIFLSPVVNIYVCATVFSRDAL
jgi:hypothetical protein